MVRRIAMGSRERLHGHSPLFVRPRWRATRSGPVHGPATSPYAWCTWIGDGAMECTVRSICLTHAQREHTGWWEQLEVGDVACGPGGRSATGLPRGDGGCRVGREVLFTLGCRRTHPGGRLDHVAGWVRCVAARAPRLVGAGGAGREAGLVVGWREAGGWRPAGAGGRRGAVQVQVSVWRGRPDTRAVGGGAGVCGLRAQDAGLRRVGAARDRTVPRRVLRC